MGPGCLGTALLEHSRNSYLNDWLFVSSPPPCFFLCQQSQNGDQSSILTLFRDLSELRGKERSLLHGDFWPVGSSTPSVFAYLRIWDQNRRYLVVLNFDAKPTKVSLTHDLLPPDATLELSTLPHQELKQQLSLAELNLGPSEGLLLSYPYVA